MRKGDAAFQDVSDFPEHSSCLSCHKEQFFARERPAPSICSNCTGCGGLWFDLREHEHIASESKADVARVDAGDPARGRQNDERRDISCPACHVKMLKMSVHDQPHIHYESCPVCHETYQPQGKSSEEYVVKPPKDIGDNFWLKKGTFKTIPNSHTICFTCHNADSGIAPEPKNCEVCHKLVRPTQLKTDFDPTLAAKMGADSVMLARWSRRISAGGFRHEGGEHPDLSCLNCHKVDNAAFSTIDLKTIKVPVKSCGGADGCHITTTVDEGGALNFEVDSRKKDARFVCTKCHVTFGGEPIPESHPQAIPTPKPKKTL